MITTTPMHSLALISRFVKMKLAIVAVLCVVVLMQLVESAPGKKFGRKRNHDETSNRADSSSDSDVKDQLDVSSDSDEKDKLDISSDSDEKDKLEKHREPLVVQLCRHVTEIPEEAPEVNPDNIGDANADNLQLVPGGPSDKPDMSGLQIYIEEVKNAASAPCAVLLAELENLKQEEPAGTGTDEATPI
ncbi:hypothetical protein ScPMuIL_017310 [Solemya velum]